MQAHINDEECTGNEGRHRARRYPTSLPSRLRYSPLTPFAAPFLIPRARVALTRSATPRATAPETAVGAGE
ncbi:hypothetical protein [Salinigranum sp. GCM10025319]|uniref:hypothetical protein n=1 Tax=Salinigranum sp. GCM10025319 TaxID=3252687 RepID=UPI0036148793